MHHAINHSLHVTEFEEFLSYFLRANYSCSENSPSYCLLAVGSGLGSNFIPSKV